MSNTIEHGQARSGLLTSSNAKTIMHGGDRGWKSLCKKLWADEGESFTKDVSDATAHGHEAEAEGAAKFWERHPEFDVRETEFIRGKGRFVGMGSSPDRLLYDASGVLVAGLEIKSPTKHSNMQYHRPRFHNDQCQHAMMITGLDRWYLVAHFENAYKEDLIEVDYRWQDKYMRNAKKFFAMCYEGKKASRKKLSITDL